MTEQQLKEGCWVNGLPISNSKQSGATEMKPISGDRNGRQCRRIRKEDRGEPLGCAHSAAGSRVECRPAAMHS